jgi:hypothetical protein
MKLSAKARKALPAKDFALGKGHYPIEDRSHARNALARVSEFGSPKEKAEVRKKVHEKYPSMGKVPRGEHHKAHHREPRTHAEFHQLGNPDGAGSQGSSEDLANRSTPTGVEAN